MLISTFKWLKSSLSHWKDFHAHDTLAQLGGSENIYLEAWFTESVAMLSEVPPIAHTQQVSFI